MSKHVFYAEPSGRNSCVGYGPTFHLIVDAPQQKVRSAPYLANAIDEVFAATGVKQRIVALEKLPEKWQPGEDVKVLRFSNDRQLLRREQYAEVAAKVAPLLAVMLAELQPPAQGDGAPRFIDHEADEF